MKIKKENDNNEIFSPAADIMEVFPTGSTAGKGIAKGKHLALRLFSRFVGYCLLRCSIQQLDKALTIKIGKPPAKGQAARNEAKAYNQGRQDERNIWKSKGYWDLDEK